jgi:hypothetical protein
MGMCDVYLDQGEGEVEALKQHPPLSFPENCPPPGDTPKPAGHHQPCRLPALSEALPRAAAPRASTPRVPRSPRHPTSRDRSSNPSTKARRALPATALREASSRKEMRYVCLWIYIQPCYTQRLTPLSLGSPYQTRKGPQQEARWW